LPRKCLNLAFGDCFMKMRKINLGESLRNTVKNKIPDWKGYSYKHHSVDQNCFWSYKIMQVDQWKSQEGRKPNALD
jgi:hypothetical protein